MSLVAGARTNHRVVWTCQFLKIISRFLFLCYWSVMGEQFRKAAGKKKCRCDYFMCLLLRFAGGLILIPLDMNTQEP